MREKILIKAPAEAQYLSDFMEELPIGIFNKKITGAGGTHIAITSKKPYIICAPTRNLCLNKSAQHPNIFSFIGGVTESKLNKYLKSTKTPKIMVTYDSLERLSALIDLNNYAILFDEAHNILNAYGYRKKAIRSCLHILKNYPVCYMTATPVEFSNLGEMFKSMPYTEVLWETTELVKINRLQQVSPYKAVNNIIQTYRKNGFMPMLNVNGETVKSYSAYFFINSVSAIMKLIEGNGLKQSEVRVVCADNDVNALKVKNYKIDNPNTPERMFTFITSSAFEGCDFYSTSGITYIVTHCHNKTTMLDVSTQIQQIAGRIRNNDNPFKNSIYHIYNTASADLSESEFNDFIKDKTKTAVNIINLSNKATQEEKEALFTKINEDANDELAMVEDGEIKIDMIKIESYRNTFKVQNLIYTSGIELRKAYGSDTPEHFNLLKSIDKIADISEDYEKIAVDYIRIKEDQTANLSDSSDELILKEMEDRFPMLAYLYGVVGAALPTKKQNATKLYEELKAKELKGASLIKALNSAFQVNSFYTLKEVKEIIKGVYEKVKIPGVAKASILSEYFEISNTQKTINNKRVKGYTIIRNKYIIKN